MPLECGNEGVDHFEFSDASPLRNRKSLDSTSKILKCYVDELLQIAPLRIMHRTDHHIDAAALLARNVPVRIGELLVGRHIAHRHADLRTGD